MKLATILAVIVAVAFIPIVQAACPIDTDVNPTNWCGNELVNDKELVDFFATESNAMHGSCDVKLVSGAGNADGYWPATSCSAISAGTQKKYHNTVPNYNLQVKSVVGNYDASQLPQIGIFADYGAITDRVDKNTFDSFSSSSTPIFKFGFCGDLVYADYTKNTITPTDILITTGGSGNCVGESNNAALVAAVVGSGPNKIKSPINYAGSQAGRDAPFTLPLKRTCTDYSFQLSAGSSPDWPVQSSVKFTQLDSKTYTYIYKSTSNAKNALKVTLKLDNNNLLDDISVYGFDGSPNMGGGFITVYCNNPTDPDTNKNMCITPPMDWLPGAAATPQNLNACCGDDGQTDVGVALSGYVCTQNSTTNRYKWKSASEYYCNNLDPKSYINDTGGGCCDQTKAGTVFTAATDQAICLDVSTSSTTQKWLWQNASKLPTLDIPGLTVLGVATKTTIVSNGSQWRACLAQPAFVSTSAPQTTPYNTQTANTNIACTTNTVDCSANTACLSACIDEENACGQNGDPNSQECIAAQACRDDCNTNEPCTNANTDQCTPISANCDTNTNTCVCGSTDTWSAGSCTAYAKCPANYVDSVTQCTLQASASSSTINVAINQSCALVSNLKLANPQQYICLDKWTLDTPSGTQYFFDATSKYLGTLGSITQPSVKSQVTQVCKNQQLSPAAHKYPPEKQPGTDSFCEASQCYSDKSGIGCVSIGDWVMGYACVNTGTTAPVGDWSSRVQVIADALFDKAPSRFTLHCDSAAQAINTPPALTSTRTGSPAYTYINNFCVLTDNSNDEGKVMAIGTTLNNLGKKNVDAISIGNAFAEDPIIGQYTSPVFPQIINSTDINLGATLTQVIDSCEQATPGVGTRTRDSQFHKCKVGGANGQPTDKLWYDAQHAAVVFSKDGVNMAGNSWLDNLKAKWNNLIGNQRTDLFIELTGDQVYVAGNGQNTVQGVMQYTDTGSKEAQIIYNNIDPSAICTAYPAYVTDCDTSLQPLYVVRLDNPPQDVWEAFTLKVRP